MAGAAPRLVALDVLRGLAVAGMILVVSPGDWGAAYSQLQHAAWNGWTLADMVFPSFLFSVGVSLGLSFPRPWREAQDRRSFWWRVTRRTILLIVIGLALEATFNWSLVYSGGAIGKPGLENLRIPGILQRIALCYLLAVIAVTGTARRNADGRLAVRPRAIGSAIALLLILYWCLLTFVPVPGLGTGRLDPEGNLGAWIDRVIFTSPHLWAMGWAHPGGPIVYDPEGLLSTLSATVNILFGVLAAWIVKHKPDRAIMIIGAVGVALFGVGLLLDPVIAINKRLWTSSFALLSSGFAAVLFAMLMGVMRDRTPSRLLTPFGILGGNAILAFILSTLLGRVYDLPIIASDGMMIAPRSWFDRIAVGVIGDPYLASLACAVMFVIVIMLALWPLHRRAFHFRL